MSHELTASSPTAALKRFSVRAFTDPESRSSLVGIMAVILIHLVLFLVMPYLFRSDAMRQGPRKIAAPRQFNIEISPDAFTKPVIKAPPPPDKYIEANPNAPDKVPDETTNFSSKNQLLAQEKPQLDQHNDKPKLEGKKDINSNQTVSGQLTKPQDSAPPVPNMALPNKNQTAPKQAKDPMAGFEKMSGTDGFGTNIGKNPDVTKPADEKVDGAKNAPLKEGDDTNQPAIDPKKPRARPMLTNPHTRPAIFQENDFGTSNMGAVAYSAKWSAYGEYLHKMMEAIQIQWDRILIESRTEPPSNTSVTVKFTIDTHGKITEIVNVESSSSEQGKQSCISAITLTAPYGEWTPDMIAVLGDSQDLTFQFYYQ